MCSTSQTFVGRTVTKEIMDVPKQCPVCGVKDIEPMFVDCMVQPLFNGDVHPLGGSLRVFWCAKSHIFMLLDCGSLRVAPAVPNRQWACRSNRSEINP